MKAKIALALTCAPFFVGCGSNKKDGMSVSIPATEPMVRSATPTAFLAGASLTLDGVSSKPTPAQAIKSRIFSKGPAEILQILANVDKAMDEIESRTNGKLVKCLADYEGDALVEKAPLAIDNKVDLDGDGTNETDLKFTQYLNCSEEPSPGFWRAFGKKSEGSRNYWYIREGATAASSSQGAVAVKVSDSTDEAEVWFRVGKESTADSMSAALAHLKRNADGTIEYTHTGGGVGYDCGLHLLTKNGLVYFTVAVDEELYNFSGKTCATMGAETDKEYCIDATGSSFATKDQATCTAAGLSKSALTLTSLTYALGNNKQVTRAFTDGAPSGISAFSAEDPPAKK